MDGDPAVDSSLDSFSLTFPLPFRVAFLVVLAVWGWGANLQGLLQLAKIDVPSLIRYPGRTSSLQPPHHLTTYRLASFLSTTFAVYIVIFWVFSHRDVELVIRYDWIPMMYLAILGALFIVPYSVTWKGRSRFLTTLRRVSIGGLAEAANGKFGDILLADVLTSYSKVLGDLFVCICMMFFAGEDGSATNRPDRNCGGTVMVPLIMAWPFMMRFRQCIIEYLRVSRSPGPFKERVGWGGTHLANAAKYASAFPVIILSALQRNRQTTEGTAAEAAPSLYRAWVFTVMLNSLYSWYWDVAKDWDLTLFTPRTHHSPDHPLGLRRRLYFPPGPGLYYCVIVLDLLLRCTWSLKLSPHLDHLSGFESSIFLVEFLEVFRRWVWIFFRVETEWIRGANTGLGTDDILLNDYQAKYQDNDDDDDD